MAIEDCDPSSELSLGDSSTERVITYILGEKSEKYCELSSNCHLFLSFDPTESQLSCVIF